MRLGQFPVSLAVKDLKVSREFYEKLGFHAVAGDGTNWSIICKTRPARLAYSRACSTKISSRSTPAGIARAQRFRTLTTFAKSSDSFLPRASR